MGKIYTGTGCLTERRIIARSDYPQGLDDQGHVVLGVGSNH